MQVPKPVRKKRDFKRKVTVESNPLECIDQETVAAWLDSRKVFYTISISGAYLHPATFNRLKRMGYKKGPSDMMIYDRPNIVENGMVYVGVCLEMKRKKGSVLSPEQKIWLDAMAERGWLVKVAYGCDDAIKFLQECGY